MSNLARKLQEEQQQRTLQTPKKAKATKQSWLSPGEKFLGLAFTAVVCFGAVNIISNQSDIYQANKDIQELNGSIEEQVKVNNELGTHVSELSTYERIMKKAKELGLKLNDNNVKVVQEK